MCGENAFFRTVAILQCGSPPRVRGKRKIPPCADEIRRITPAHAGKTFCNSAFLRSGSDHPRACGENLSAVGLCLSPGGSPPRMRGKHLLPGKQGRLRRITPAHAGKTRLSPFRLRMSSNHPRACGENSPTVPTSVLVTGSPPRMRGKPHRVKAVVKRQRITPAHAGKTTAQRFRRCVETDHPRACGENSSCSGIGLLLIGSPPRMRGKPRKDRHLVLVARITPAHAGKTDSGNYRQSSGADHPRACGENSSALLALSSALGSPPRMRGKLPGSRGTVRKGRITPAHAGKTSLVSGLRSVSTDHPRACGENNHVSLLGNIFGGSPPRMRGKRSSVPPKSRTLRITPAHAGKTCNLL